MKARADVTVLRFTPAPRSFRHDGLLGWVILQVGDLLVVDGVEVRRSRRGRQILSFPRKRGGGRGGDGTEFSIVRPLDQRARDRLEQLVLSEIRGDVRS